MSVAAAFTAAACAPAASQVNIDPGFIQIVPGSHPPAYEDGTDLGRAMQLCAVHEAWQHTLTDPPLAPTYQKGWEGCAAVRDAWWAGEAGRREQARQQKEEEDRRFVAGVAEQLKRGAGK